MISHLGEEQAFGSITEFFQSMLNAIGMDNLMLIIVGLMLAIIVLSAVRLIWCYEFRAMRQMKKINKYHKEHPHINDDNLVQFHHKIKRMPKRFRERWQLFMLERDGSPSKYLTMEYCIKRPLYNSSILTVHKIIIYTTVIISLLSLLMGLSFGVTDVNAGATMLNILQACLTPIFCILLGGIYCLILHLCYTNVNHNLYDLFTNFVRNIDKSSSTMPDYVDYEILFTKKEINAGIPVLREYLEKKALEEQRLLEKAKKEEANQSPYDFSDLGVNGEQLIERAVTESESFLLIKLKRQEEIADLEKQLQKSEEKMEDLEREANRKLQAIKENLERLDKAMAETTNNVEVNYNRRQVNSEMQKKEALEKDLQSMLAKEKVSADALRIEIQKRKESIEKDKAEVEVALKSEYNTFATKVYQELNEKVTRDNAEQLHDLEMMIAKLKAKVKESSKELDRYATLLDGRNIELENLRKQLSMLNAKKGKKKKGDAPEEPVYQPVSYQDGVFKEAVNANDYTDQPAPTYQEQSEQPMFADSTAYDQPANYQPNVYYGDYQQPSYNAYPQQDYTTQPLESYPVNNDVYYADPTVITPQYVDQNQVTESPQMDTWAQPMYAQETIVDNTVLPYPQEEIIDNTANPVVEEPIVDNTVLSEQPAPENVEQTGEPVAEGNETQPVEVIEQPADDKAQEPKAETIDEPEQKTVEKKTRKTKAKADEEKNANVVTADDLVAIQKQIEEENKKLKEQQEELRAQIDNTLKAVKDATEKSTKSENKTQNIKEIKALISKLKDEAAKAKARGASKAEINKINKSVAELLKVITDYQSGNGSKK